jgi:hypothetical protein
MIGLDSNYYAELNNDNESYSDMRHREAEDARKGHEEWERVRVALLCGAEESGRTLNDRICDEFEWAVDVENVLAGGKHVMDLYSFGLLSSFYEAVIRKEAETLASIIVGADHE